MKTKHLKLKSIPRRLPLCANEKGPAIMDPCAGLTGTDLKKCERKAYKGGVVY